MRFKGWKLDLDYKEMGFWLDVAQWLSIGAVAVWGYLRGKDDDNATAIKAVNKSVVELRAVVEAGEAEQNLRLATIEERMRHIPNAEELARIEGDVSEVRTKVEGTLELLKRVEHQTNLIHQHLLNGR